MLCLLDYWTQFLPPNIFIFFVFFYITEFTVVNKSLPVTKAAKKRLRKEELMKIRHVQISQL